jgi:hypothetical protein
MEFLISFFYFIIFGYCIYKFNFFRAKNLPSYYFFVAFTLKLIATFFQIWLYRNHNFGGDSFSFFSSGRIVNGFSFTDPQLFLRTLFGTLSSTDLKTYFKPEMFWTNDDLFFNDNPSIIKINALMYFISGGYFLVHGVLFSFLAFVGFTSLFKFFLVFYPERPKEIFAITFLIPSTLFWCAGSSKESWLIFCLGLFLYFLDKLMHTFKLKLLLQCMLLCYLLVFIKLYFLLALVPSLIAYFLAIKFKTIAPVLVFSTTYIVGFVGLMNLPFFDFLHYLQFKQHSFQYLAQWSQSNSKFTIPDIGNNTLSLILNMPVALKNMLFRPYLWEASSFLWVLAAIENILLAVLICIFMVGFKWNHSKAQISLFCLFFALSILVLTGLTTPVIGGLVRYKAPLLPFLLMFFYYNFDFHLFNSRVGLPQRG